MPFDRSGLFHPSYRYEVLAITDDTITLQRDVEAA